MNAMANTVKRKLQGFLHTAKRQVSVAMLKRYHG